MDMTVGGKKLTPEIYEWFEIILLKMYRDVWKTGDRHFKAVNFGAGGPMPPFQDSSFATNTCVNSLNMLCGNRTCGFKSFGRVKCFTLPSTLYGKYVLWNIYLSASRFYKSLIPNCGLSNTFKLHPKLRSVLRMHYGSPTCNSMITCNIIEESTNENFFFFLFFYKSLRTLDVGLDLWP